MKTKQLVAPAILLVMALVTAISAMAWGGGTLTLATPTSGGVVQGTFTFSVTTDGGANLSNVTIFAKGPVYTRNSTNWVNVTSNFTVSGCLGFNATNNTCTIKWDTSALSWEDGSAWQWIAQACNQSGNASLATPANCVNSSTVTAILHTANPKAPSSMLPATATTDTDGKVSFSATVGGNGTTDCTLYFVAQAQYKAPNGLTAIDMDHDKTLDTCTYTFSGMPAGQYYWYVSADDDTNETKASTRNVLTIDTPTGTGLRQQYIAEQQQASAQTQTDVKVGTLTGNRNTIAALILIIVLVMVFGRKKKHK